jgi:1,5-anhydro-D-fructose reductase (1,5-anhydro-D-mannitol-forming)
MEKPKKMVRFGILGFGLHAAKRLMPGFQRARNSTAVALSRRDLTKAQESARTYGIPLAFNSATELCRCPEVDVVFVATPNACHLADTLLALECGKPVLCEKPMGMNAAECKKMVDAAGKAGLLLGIAQVFRFADSVLRIRERLLAGQIGEPVLARGEFSYDAAHHPRQWINNLSLAGGGPIADVGVHCIDVLRFVLRDEVRAVQAFGVFDGAEQVESAAILTLEFRKGTLGTVLVSKRVGYRTPVEIVGNAGTLRADDGLSVDRPVLVQLTSNGVTQTEELRNDLAYARQVDTFAAALEQKTDFPAPGEEGWRNQLVLDAAYRSLKSGKSEQIVTVL